MIFLSREGTEFKESCLSSQSRHLFFTFTFYISCICSVHCSYLFSCIMIALCFFSFSYCLHQGYWQNFHLWCVCCLTGLQMTAALYSLCSSYAFIYWVGCFLDSEQWQIIYIKCFLCIFQLCTVFFNDVTDNVLNSSRANIFIVILDYFKTCIFHILL